jgi:cytochrome c peroxidase
MKYLTIFWPYKKFALVLGCMLTAILIGFTLISFKPTDNEHNPDNIVLEKAKLGRYLFYDNRLSYNFQKSCASCHDPKFCFTDGYRTSSGSDGFNVKHNAPSLINATFLNYFTWADSSLHHLKDQMKNPLFNTHPTELGMRGNEKEILHRIEIDSFYNITFKKAFPLETKPINVNNTILAIAAFESTLTSFNSAYDQYRKGNASALNKTELAGMRLFFSDSLNCSKCHDKPSRSIIPDFYYANTGLYNLSSDGSYPTNDQGLFEMTGNQSDKGKFRIPSLKNVLLTAPYTHDGSVATIQEMISIYSGGGRNVLNGNDIGDGRLNPYKSPYLKGFTLSKAEQTNLIAFLNTFTDTSNLHNANWNNPFKQ